MARMGFIWPKDPQPGNPDSWPRRWRFTDVLHNMGPDIYVGPIGKERKRKKGRRRGRGRPEQGVPKIHWDMWDQGRGEQDGYPLQATYPGPFYACNQRLHEPGQQSHPWLGPTREGKIYDYRQRKYILPDEGTWSKVEYCDFENPRSFLRRRREGQHCVPVQYRDKNGMMYPAYHWHDLIHGRKCREFPAQDSSPPVPHGDRSGNGYHRPGHTSHPPDDPRPPGNRRPRNPRNPPGNPAFLGGSQPLNSGWPQANTRNPHRSYRPRRGEDHHSDDSGPTGSIYGPAMHTHDMEEAIHESRRSSTANILWSQSTAPAIAQTAPRHAPDPFAPFDPSSLYPSQGSSNNGFRFPVSSPGPSPRFRSLPTQHGNFDDFTGNEASEDFPGHDRRGRRRSIKVQPECRTKPAARSRAWLWGH
ncbi:hypothetical protein N7468_006645 [Penicillium chermesinum]|uniref:Uncharacterized protein n=1 Tax=Penicillium chermesinum TaxID=63820 RepID=A0A9W9NSM6_9EURO|nr:uncharacterized protein N7468_006645 [Penicillium chermesinum]KAJ5225420.1 hypothetical protein N7468_006645 [Penicillium chermesinum]